MNNDKSLTPDEQETSPSADSGEKEQAPGAAPSVPDKEETSPSGNQSTSAAGAGTKKSGGNKKAADKKHKSGRGKGVLWLLLIVLLAGAGGAWWWYGGLSLPLPLKQRATHILAKRLNSVRKENVPKNIIVCGRPKFMTLT